MTAKRKFGFIFALLPVLVLSFAFGIAGMAKTVVKAEAPAESDKTYTGYYMDKGASVRAEIDYPGIRFTSVITKTAYEAMLADNAGATITFHTVIAPVADVTDGDVNNLTPETVARNTVIDSTLFNDAEEKPFAEIDGVGEAFRINAVLANFAQSEFGETLMARGFALITAGETVTRVWATPNDNVRSMREVAYKALVEGKEVDGEGETNASAISKYLINNEEVAETYAEVGHGATYGVAGTMVMKFDKDVVAVYKNAEGVMNAEDNAALTPDEDGYIDISTGFENVTTDDAAFLTEGTVKVIKSNMSVQIVKYLKVTSAIRTASDLSAFDVTTNYNTIPTVLKGYFVLANNIDYDATASVNRHSGLKQDSEGISWVGGDGSQYGFGGTFDGRGNYMSFGVYSGGLFGMLAGGAIIQRVAMLDVKYTATDANVRSTVVASQAPWGNDANGNGRVYFDNLYITVKDFRSAVNGNRTSAFMYFASNGEGIKSTIIDVARPEGYLAAADAEDNNNNSKFVSGVLYAQNDKLSGQSRGAGAIMITDGFMYLSMDESLSRAYRTIAVSDQKDFDGTNGTINPRYSGLFSATTEDKQNLKTYVLSSDLYSDTLKLSNVPQRLNTAEDINGLANQNFCRFDPACWDKAKEAASVWATATRLPQWKNLPAEA